ncbi:pilin [Luteimonas vadosa]|uniref:Pilin n=1 Tax=Luteimonas vadosa TaxID=1165507 RepID=A0ABP9DMP9_9GAMM
MKMQKGFTLIELMIVIAIIAILLAIAIPAYQDYQVRTRVSEGLNVAAAAKLAVSETFSSRNTLPANNTSAGLPAATSINGNAVRSVTVGANGIITVAYSGAPINANSLTLTPTANAANGSIRWQCRSANLPAKWLPSECRG